MGGAVLATNTTIAVALIAPAIAAERVQHLGLELGR